MRVAVCGGSIGGLGAALSLAQRGHDVVVFERSSEVGQQPGGGIVLQPPMAELLRRVGIDPRSVLEPVRGRQFLDGVGNIDGAIESPQDMTNWKVLWSALVKALHGKLGTGAYVTSAAVVGVDVREDGKASLKFGDDEMQSRWGRDVFDLVVAADGATSAIRRSLSPDSLPQYAGYVAWRGVLEESDVPSHEKDLLDGWFTFYHDVATHILLYMIPSPDKAGSRLLNWVWYWNVGNDRLPSLVNDMDGEKTRPRFSVPPGKLNKAAMEEVQQLASSVLPDSLRKVVHSTKKPFLQPIYDFKTERCVYQEAKVVLVGDAQSVVRPHTAYGTAKAAEDAMWLADALGCEEGFNTTVLSQLKKWEQICLVRNDQIIGHGQALGAQSQATNVDAESSKPELRNLMQSQIGAVRNGKPLSGTH